MIKSKTVFLVLLLLYIHSYGQTDQSPAGIMISHAHAKERWMFGYSLMQMNMKENINGDTKISDERIYDDYLMAPSEMHMNMHMFMAMYGVTGRTTIMVMGSYISNSMKMNIFSGTNHTHQHSGSLNAEDMRMKTSGLGDTKLTGIHKFVNGNHITAIASAGINIPTGNFRINGNPHVINANERFPYMMQCGTGAVDFSPGITCLGLKGKVSWSCQLIYTIRPFKNSIGYHYGNEFLVNGWFSYKFLSFSSASFRTEAQNVGRMTGKDASLTYMNEPSADYRNYGGTKVNSYLGINFYPSISFLKESKFALEFGIPLYQNYNGIQQNNRSTIFASYTISI